MEDNKKEKNSEAEEKEQRNIARLKEAIEQKGIFAVAKETVKEVMEEYPAYDYEDYMQATLHEPKDKEKADKLAKHGTLAVLSKYLNVMDHTIEEEHLIRELSKKYNINTKQENNRSEEQTNTKQEKSNEQIKDNNEQVKPVVQTKESSVKQQVKQRNAAVIRPGTEEARKEAQRITKEERDS